MAKLKSFAPPAGVGGLQQEAANSYYTTNKAAKSPTAGVEPQGPTLAPYNGPAVDPNNALHPVTDPQSPQNPGGGGNNYNSFDQFWNGYGNLNLGEAAGMWNTLHNTDQATPIGHSGDAVRYRGKEYDGIFSVGSPEQRRQWIELGGGGGGNGGGGGGGTPDLQTLMTQLHGQGGGQQNLANGMPLTAPGAGSPFAMSGGQGFTDQITGAYSKLLGGNTPFDNAIQKQYMDYLSPQQSQGRQNARVESARETMDRGRKAQLSNIQGTLADRGILGESGIAQGPEQSSYSRLEESIAPVYSQALRDAIASEDTNTLNALQGAGSYSNALKQQYLGAAQGAGNYQQGVTQLALQNLQQNVQWQEFLGTYGLDQARLQYEIDNGNIDNVLALFQLYLNAAQISANGYV